MECESKMHINGNGSSQSWWHQLPELHWWAASLALPIWISAAAMFLSVPVHYVTQNSPLEYFIFLLGRSMPERGNLQVAPPTSNQRELVEKWLQLSVAANGIMLRDAEYCCLRSPARWSLSFLVRNIHLSARVIQNLRNGDRTEIKRYLLGIC